MEGSVHVEAERSRRSFIERRRRRGGRRRASTRAGGPRSSSPSLPSRPVCPRCMTRRMQAQSNGLPVICQLINMGVSFEQVVLSRTCRARSDQTRLRSSSTASPSSLGTGLSSKLQELIISHTEDSDAVRTDTSPSCSTRASLASDSSSSSGGGRREARERHLGELRRVIRGRVGSTVLLRDVGWGVPRDHHVSHWSYRGPHEARRLDWDAPGR